MTSLAQFIATKPTGARLGQHFYNAYFKHLKPEHNKRRHMDLLYNTMSDTTALMIIKEIMKTYQWEELPDG